MRPVAKSKTAAVVVAAALAIGGVANAGPVVTVTGGAVEGTMEGSEAVFKNIPFAAPPVGELRWRAPAPVLPWTRTRDATRFGHACVQPQAPDPDEDCLQLNVWSPEWPAKAPRAVMVWFHGGGNTEGWDSTPFNWGTDLAKHGVVVVTAQYRLGVLGFFADAELDAESRSRASGNYGLLDQIAALKWVRDNITTFGGDPKNVTIFGQSAGAEDVGLLMVSPLSAGLFQRAIAESGPLRRYYPSLRDQEQSCHRIAAALGAPEKGTLAFLRAVPARPLVAAAFANEESCQPVNLDGYVLPEQPLKTYADEREHAVPFMLGNTLREGFERINLDGLKALMRRQYGAQAPRVAAAYGLSEAGMPPPDPHYGNIIVQYGTDQSQRCRVELIGLGHAASGRPFYQFQFSRDLPGQTPNSSTHTDELPFVFGAAAYQPLHLTRPEDVKLSDQIESYWTNFAKTGDPNGSSLPEWKRFEGANRPYMSFTAEGPVAGEALRRAQCDLFLAEEARRPSWKYPERAWH
jgi:para-nitrobenzyl esterase